MKKLIALSIAVVMLLLGFATAVETSVVRDEITLCEDLKPKPEPHDTPALI